MLYLQWVFGADSQDLVLEVAELTAPGASFTDPPDKAGLVSTADRAITATRAQQLPLQDTESSCSIHRGGWILKLLCLLRLNLMVVVVVVMKILAFKTIHLCLTVCPASVHIITLYYVIPSSFPRCQF